MEGNNDDGAAAAPLLDKESGKINERKRKQQPNQSETQILIAIPCYNALHIAQASEVINSSP